MKVLLAMVLVGFSFGVATAQPERTPVPPIGDNGPTRASVRFEGRRLLYEPQEILRAVLETKMALQRANQPVEDMSEEELRSELAELRERLRSTSDMINTRLIVCDGVQQ